MTAATRLVSYADIACNPFQPGKVSVSVRHELELGDGRRVLLLDDRGWSSSASWGETSIADIEETARVVVGPDEPVGGRTQADAQADHWVHLQEVARRSGAAVDAAKLRSLPHDVVLGPDLLARIGAGSDA